MLHIRLIGGSMNYDRRCNVDRRRCQIDVAIERRISTDRRSIEDRRSGEERREQQRGDMRNDRRAYI